MADRAGRPVRFTLIASIALVVALAMSSCDATPGHGYDTPSSSAVPGPDPFAFRYGPGCEDPRPPACGDALSYTQTAITINDDKLLRPTYIAVTGSVVTAVSRMLIHEDVEMSKGDAEVFLNRQFRIAQDSGQRVVLEGIGDHQGWRIVLRFHASGNDTVETAILTVPLPTR